MLVLATLLLTISGDVNAGRSARLLPDEPLLAQEEAPLPRTSIQQLEVDLRALQRMRPSYGAPGAFIGIGGGLALAGGLFVFVGALTVTSAEVLLWFGAAVAGVGVCLVALGVWLLVERIEERGRVDRTILELRRQLAEQRQQRVSDAPPAFTPSVTLARF